MQFQQPFQQLGQQFQCSLRSVSSAQLFKLSYYFTYQVLMVLFEMPFGYFVVKGNQLNGTNSSETAEWFNRFLCRYVKPIPIGGGRLHPTRKLVSFRHA